MVKFPRLLWSEPFGFMTITFLGKRFTFHVDWPLLLGILALSCIGMLVLYSAKKDFLFLSRQMLRFALAFLLMLAVTQLHPRYFKQWSYWLYGAGLVLLILVLVIGSISKGAQRWLDLWVIRFQPAELMKLAVPMTIAHYLENMPLPPKSASLLIPVILILLPALLIAKQPDLGTAILIIASGSLVIFLAGIPWKTLATMGGLALLSAPLLWFVMHDYQRKRILTLLNPERDPLGSGYHIIQSKIALGSGGIFGKGWLNGSQANLEFLPEKTTDFIFAVFGEEFGFIGILILLLLYLFIILRGLTIGAQAQDTFTRLLASSLALTFFVYVFVNISMVTGILPVVGIPLPLMSYGGTSLVTIMLSFGILMSIQTHRRLLAK